MPAWRPSGSGNGSAPPSGGAGASRTFYGTGAAPGNGGGIYHPTPSGGGTGTAGEPAPPNVGVVSINPLDPIGSAEAAKDPLTGLFDGLKNGLFGTSAPDASGQHGGILGDVPGVGDVLRGGAETIANIGGAVAAGTGEVLGAARDITEAAGVSNEAIDQKMKSPEMQAWLDEKNAATGKANREDFGVNTGIFGTGIGVNQLHQQAAAIKAFEEHQQLKNPTLFGGKFTAAPTIADTVGTLFDVLGASADVVQRTVAGMDKTNGQDQLDLVKAVGSGQMAWDTFSPENTPVEQIAYEKTKSGEWTDDQALDWLATHGAGYSHDVRLQIAGTVGLDPLNVATFGAGAVAKAGLTGVRVAQDVAAAAKVAEEARAGLSAAEEALAAMKVGQKGIKAARAAVEEAKTAVTKADEVNAARKGFQSSGNISRVNVLAKGVEGSEKVQDLFRVAGKVYGGLEGTYIGRAAKVTRTIIDPLNAIDLHMPGGARTVDLMSDSLTKTLSSSAGDTHYLANLNLFKGADATGAAVDSYAKDLAVAMGNRGREGILTLHQTGAVQGGLDGRLAGATGAGLRDEVIEQASKSMKEKDLLSWLRYDVTKNIIQHNWGEAEHLDLARTLESRYHINSADEWMKMLPKMSKEQKSLLKLAVYGNSNNALLAAVSAAKASGHAAATEFDLERAVLLSKSTLTRVGGDSLLSQLKAVKGKRQLQQQIDVITKWQVKYPQLRVIAIDAANPGKSIKRFTEYVENHLDSLPMQFKDDELAKMPDGIKNLSNDLGEGYQLGFRPKDEFLWGIERSNEKGGEYIAKHAPWADHVGYGDAGKGFRPGHEMPLNIAGMPIIGKPVAAATKAIDYVEAGSRVVKAQVSGQQIIETARAKFVSDASRAKFAEHGLTEQVAQKWWDRLQEYTREHQGYSGPRGFGKGDLYAALSKENLIPQTMLNGSMKLQESDVLRMVLEAYDGDMRYIGLTQKLSGRAKKVLSAATGYNSNFAGQIAEHAWPTLKFRYNPMFQLQEKVEPWVLNAQRGVSVHLGSGASASQADLATERLLQRMTDNSLIRQADLDQAEYSSQVLLGKALGATAKTPTTKLAKMTGMAQTLMDVQGTKRINMLRTFRQGLGKELRSAWDEARPGEWDQMFEHARARSLKPMDEDEFALQVMGENLFANDILVTRMQKAGRGAGLKADWANAVKPGAWATPTHFGELKGLDLDHIAASLGVTGENGKRIENLGDLRGYLAADHKRIGEVSDFLNRMGADPDYVSRVENSLTFSWEGFWREAGKRYSLTNEESKSLQDMMAGAAEVRGMQPADFMSQVFHPGIIDGQEGILGSLDKPLGLLRRNKAGEVRGVGRTRLAGKEGVSTREDLVQQLSATFSQHLDPSAKRALLMEFKPELRQAVLKGDVRLDLNDLSTMWDAEADGLLADRILGYMDGKPPAGGYDVITDEARGSADIREGVRKFMDKNGVTIGDERRNVHVDEAHYDKTATEYGALPTVDYEKTGRRPMTKSVYNADTDLKPQPAGVDDRTYAAYQQFVNETKAQWDHMTMPKAKGGMGIKVTVAKGDPYTADEVGRAAMMSDLKKGTLRVKGTDSDHPLMTNEQNTMFRAVHDVFGHAANDFEFGPRGELNAAASHFQMYGADARGPLLTETHGQTAYVNYSNDVYDPFVNGVKGVYTPPADLDPLDPIGSFESMHKFAIPEGQAAERPSLEAALADPDFPSAMKAELRSKMPADPGTGYFEARNLAGNEEAFVHYNQFVGDGIRNLPTEQQGIILQQVSDLLNEFPDMRIHHVDVVDLSGTHIIKDPKDPNKVLQYGLGDNVNGVAFGSDEGEAVMLLSDKGFGMDFEDAQQFMYDNNEFFRQRRTRSVVVGKDEHGPLYTQEPRLSHMGAGHNFDPSAQGLIRHEAGHALDLSLRPRVGNTPKRLAVHGDYYDTFARLEGSTDARKWLSEYGMTDSKEFAAELFSAATDPNLVLDDLPAKLRPMVTDYQDALRNGGYWKPTYAPDPEELAKAGKTVRELNAAKRGTVYAPQKAGLLPQESIDEFARQFVGLGKHLESNPDVARTAQMFGKWSSAAVNNGLLRGEQGIHSGLLNDIAKIPTHSAAPYNLTEGLAQQLANSTMVRKWQDAFRLQYFAQNRTMLERSINHPMFGLYPASYMWGKLMPEIVQFIAQRPFGIRTGGAAYSLMDTQAAIAMQREFNPEFDAHLEKLGHSQALSFAGYLLPTLPWDVSASAPTWMKDVANQGQRNKATAESGFGQVEGFNATQPLTDVVSRLNPMETNIAWAGRAADELNGANTPTEQRTQLVEQLGATKATGISDELAAIQAELKAMLSR